MNRYSARFVRLGRTSFLLAGALALGACEPSSDPGAAADPPADMEAAATEGVPTLTIGGLDYAFDVPESIPSGPVEIVFENRGEVPHELAIALLAEGTTAEEFGAVMQGGGDPEDMMEAVVGILIADPGETALGRLEVDLESGRTYILGCMFTDAEGDPPHVALGMIRGVTID